VRVENPVEFATGIMGPHSTHLDPDPVHSHQSADLVRQRLRGAFD
jgi:hypothetical protein